jgi:CBS domain containing-hemolysin-like protein
MPGPWPPDAPHLSSLPISPAAAATVVVFLATLLALLEAALTGLSRGVGAATARHWNTHLRGSGDPARLRRAGALLRVVLLLAIAAVAVAFGTAGSAVPAVVALITLSVLHMLEQQGRLRLFGARAAWLASAWAIVLKPLARLMPEDGGEPADGDGTIAGSLEDMADLLATAPEDRRQMVQALLSLEDSTVEDIMVPRSDVVGVDIRSDWDDIIDQLSRTPHTRLPLYEGDLEHVIGVVHMKRIANELAMGRLNRQRLREVATRRDALFVPEGTTLQAQLIAFRKLKRRIAFVVDEYGDVLGLVTLEDILEEVVGEFTTQPGSLSRDVLPQDDGSFVVSGSAAVRAVNRTLGWELPTDGPRTISGLIIEQLETIPEAGTSLRLGDHAVEVLQVADYTVRTARFWAAHR